MGINKNRREEGGGGGERDYQIVESDGKERERDEGER